MIYYKNSYYRNYKKICDLMAKARFMLKKRYAIKIAADFISLTYMKKNFKINFKDELIYIDEYCFSDPEDALDYIKELSNEII